MSKEYFEISCPKRLLAGENALQKAILFLAEEGFRAPLVVTDEFLMTQPIFSFFCKKLEQQGYYPKTAVIPAQEPTDETVRLLHEETSSLKFDLLIGFGGGSVLDCVKIISALSVNEGMQSDLFDAAGIVKKGVPTLMIPTTAGTGAETTPNAIILNRKTNVKTGVISRHMIADYVVLDPALTESLPPIVAAATGLDTLAHALECRVSKKANGFTNFYADEAVRLVFGNLERVCREKSSKQARLNMLLAAYYGGVCISGASTNVVHAMAYPLSSRFHMSHGLSVGILLPVCMKAMEKSCTDVFTGYGQMLRLSASFCDGLFDLAARCRVPSSLAAYGVTENDIPAMVEEAMAVKRLFSQSPVPFSYHECSAIYQKLL